MSHVVAKNASGETLTQGDVVVFDESYPQGALTVPSTVTVATTVPTRLLICAPGAGRLPTCTRALSGSLGLTAQLGVVIGAFEGGANVDDEDLAVVQIAGFLDYELAGSPSVGDPVYLDADGDLSLTEGPGVEILGHVHESTGGQFRVWLTSSTGSSGVSTGGILRPTNTEELRAAIASAIRLGGVGVTLNLEGDIEVDDTITIQGVRWLRWRGGNLIWTRTGTPDRPLLKLIDCADCSFEDAVVTCQEPLLEAVRIQSGPAATGPYIVSGLQSSHLTFSRWTIRGQDRMGIGFRIYVRDGVSSVRCDHMRFLDCRVAGYVYSAYHLEGRNSKDLIIENSFTQGISPIYESLYCVDNSRRGPEASGYNGMIAAVGSETFGDGGSFSFTGQCSGNTIANFRLSDRAAVIKIGRCYSEKSRRHLIVPRYGAGSSGALPIVLEANHFAVHATQFAADREVIQNYSYGPLTIIGGSFGRPRTGEQVRFRHESVGAFVMQGAFVANDGDGNVFPYGAPTNTDYTVTNNGFRDDITGPLGVGVVIPTDGPALRSYPQSVAQWTAAGFSPSSQWSFSDVPQVPAWAPNTLYATGDFVSNDGGRLYKCKSGGTSASSGGPTGTGTSISDGITDEDLGLEPAVWNFYDTGANVISDIVSVRHAVVIGTVDYEQTRTGFTRKFIRLTETSGESIRLNYTGYSPITDAVAVVLDFEVVAVGGTRKLIQLGNTSTSVGGGGLLLELNSAGNLLLCHDGDVLDVGSHVYEADGTVHRVLLGWDPAADGGNGDFFFATDVEFVRWTPAAPPITPANNATKGFGANSGTAPDVYLTYPVWFYGAKARAIMAPAGRTFLGVDATP